MIISSDDNIGLESIGTEDIELRLYGGKEVIKKNAQITKDYGRRMGKEKHNVGLQTDLDIWRTRRDRRKRQTAPD